MAPIITFQPIFVEKITNAESDKMPIHGPYQYTWVYFLLYVSTMLPKNKWIVSNVALEVVFPDELFFALIPYYFSIRVFMNSWKINADPWSYEISVDQGYLVIHIVSTNFAIFIAHLSLYCVISNHRVMGLTVVTDFRFRSSFFNLLHII